MLIPVLRRPRGRRFLSVGLPALLAVLFLGAPGAWAAPPGNGVNADFNGDGYADLAVGKPGEDVGGAVDAGAVNVSYGSSSGVRTAGTQLWHQTNLGIVGDSAEGGEAFGSSLAAGDFNDDGFSDLAVGAPLESVAIFGGIDAVEAGAVDVIYGSSAGLTASGAQFLHQESNIRSTAIGDRVEDGDHFGETLAAADFGAGGQADLAIGVPFEEVDGVSQAGAWNVVYGSSGGLNDSFGPSSQFWHQNVPGVEDALEVDDRAGLALAAADFGRTGEADLAIGVPFEQSVDGIADAGAVHVLYGGPQGLTATDDQFWHQNRPDVEDQVEAFDFTGSALAAGNVGKSGHAELVIGSPGEDFGADFDAGAVNVLYGGSNGLTASGDQLWHQNSSGVADSVEPADGFGNALAIGDLGRGGPADLAVGAYEEDLGAVADAGVVHVLYGTSTGLSATASQLWHQNSSGVADAAEAGDRFGSSVGAWNLGRGSQADLAVGVRTEDVGAATDAGAVNVLYGGSNGLAATGNAFLTQEDLGYQSETDDVFGRALVP